MIVKFSVQNFGSIKDEQILSFEADKSEHLEDYYIIPINGLRLLKLGLIYGANASGKTTILKALDFLRRIVLNPQEKKTTEFNYEPFLFDIATPHQNTILSIEFIYNSTRYYYEVELNKKAIVKEELNFYSPNKANVFKRTTNLETQFTEITFGSKIKIDKIFEKNLESNTLWNNTVLGGFLKTNIQLKELKDVTDWFEYYLKPLIRPKVSLDRFIIKQLEESKIRKEDIIQILQKADFYISDILIEKDEEIEDKIDFEDSIKKMKSFQRIKDMLSYQIQFEHTLDNRKFNLPFKLESEGTQRYYGFAEILSLMIRDSCIFPIDELESSLHPDLYTHFLLSFLVNSKKSQIIATTHNREILNNKDIFRNDAIWITDKSENCATELYSLSDFDTSVIRDTSNIYNAYKIGKLGGIPNLGDYYIDIEE
ncbi:ATP/GTP-binding protein [Dysgonomonas sp. 511]|uniref:AAA family ATPase n=1 Tax=Dysgonomonas sp. 511 TaxID=2302930 RepID=UPI0013D1CA85|nr:ATP-binding protein [Dysgonomonas sp. 511]NDV79701.1 ATP-binding protein [Dysgonomonas sp. 511]